MSDLAAVRYRAVLAYDGTNYQGFQRQAGETPTVQAAVEQAISAVVGQPVTVIGAGRTDSGVHAIGQVIAFDVVWKHGAEALLKAVNVKLPDDIALQEVRQAGADFHPRYDAVSRVYKYWIVQSDLRQPLLRHRAWQMRSKLDADAMDAAAMLLLGEHDFATFGQPTVGDITIRLVMESHWTRRRAPYGTDWMYTIEANGFLKHMVRRIVGALVDVGRGALTVEAFEQALQVASLVPTGQLAPPQGLALELVKYAEG